MYAPTIFDFLKYIIQIMAYPENALIALRTRTCLHLIRSMQRSYSQLVRLPFVLRVFF